MRLQIVSVGQTSKGPERELCERYEKRIKPAAQTQGFLWLPTLQLKESRLATADARKVEEAQNIQKHLAKTQPLMVILDEKGTALSSQDIAQCFDKESEKGTPHMVFIIGGPDGLSQDIKATAHIQLGFGRVTWPHQLVHVMLLEQIYRALTIRAGHPYHRV